MSVRVVATALLQRLGYAVLAAGGGAEALELFGRHRSGVCCVIADLTMPGMDGWELLSALRKIQPHLPVVLASGYSEEQAMDRARPELPQAFLQKPYSKSELQNALRQALETGAQEAG